MLPAGAGAAIGRIRVQLDSLEEYAQKLEGQIGELEAVQGELRSNPAFGEVTNFGEARGLHDLHQEALTYLRQLYSQIHAGMQSGQSAIRYIAENYRTTDENHKAEMDYIERTLDA